MRGGREPDRLSPSEGDGPLGLRRDRACFRDLSWRVQLPAEVSFSRLRQRLVDSGFVARDPGPGVVTFETADGHMLVMVPRTGRVQIRVDYVVPVPQRARVAERLAQVLVAEAT